MIEEKTMPLNSAEGQPKPSLPQILVIACCGKNLERLNVRRLPTLGSLYHVELHSLALLKAFETVRIDRRVMNKHILAVLTADEAKPLSVVKPLHCSLFHIRYSLML
jgi:hypothetical protein